MNSMAFHQSHVTQWQSLFTLINYLAIVFSFILISTDNRFLPCMMAFRIVSSYYLSHMKQSITTYLVLIGCSAWSLSTLKVRQLSSQATHFILQASTVQSSQLAL